MNSLRITRKGIYEIEVNDNGDTIKFDLDDIELPFKCYEAIENIEKLLEEAEKLEEAIRNSEMTEKEQQEKAKELTQKTFSKIREQMDSFLGEGACQKIFGDSNYYTMFDDLIEELARPREELGGKSHFDNLELTRQGINQRIVSKYQKIKGKNVI